MSLKKLRKINPYLYLDLFDKSSCQTRTKLSHYNGHEKPFGGFVPTLFPQTCCTCRLICFHLLSSSFPQGFILQTVLPYHMKPGLSSSFLMLFGHYPAVGWSLTNLNVRLSSAFILFFSFFWWIYSIMHFFLHHGIVLITHQRVQ